MLPRAACALPAPLPVRLSGHALSARRKFPVDAHHQPKTDIYHSQVRAPAVRRKALTLPTYQFRIFAALGKIDSVREPFVLFPFLLVNSESFALHAQCFVGGSRLRRRGGAGSISSASPASMSSTGNPCAAQYARSISPSTRAVTLETCSGSRLMPVRPESSTDPDRQESSIRGCSSRRSEAPSPRSRKGR